MNKLYILRPIDVETLWSPWFDKSFGFIVCASSPIEARKLAQKSGGDETRNYGGEDHPAWTDPKYSTCKELKPSENSEIVMQDFHAA